MNIQGDGKDKEKVDGLGEVAEGVFEGGGANHLNG